MGLGFARPHHHRLGVGTNAVRPGSVTLARGLQKRSAIANAIALPPITTGDYL
ncbi:MAG: hypothetical protein HC857_02435 [Synechococcales cyanobacterium RU_4_20]|nr:hypothetical protein [Synechococcales cyanobacterium RU_4_20]